MPVEDDFGNSIQPDLLRRRETREPGSPMHEAFAAARAENFIARMYVALAGGHVIPVRAYFLYPAVRRAEEGRRGRPNSSRSC